MSNFLEQLAGQWKQGKPQGIYSVCSAHPWVLEAAIDQAMEDGSHLLIEATSNQVNHQGGYTGMQPEDFKRLVVGIATAKGFDLSKLILGGDHLGPNAWQKQSAELAMVESVKMVEGYVKAGFHKIHLDASMACAGEQAPLSDETIAGRAATLCAAAERVAGDKKPVYVIGTEVPVPGGATESLNELVPTSREAAAKTLTVHRKVFADAGLAAVWPRVIALVVQPGVEFNHDSVVDYDPKKATHLTQLLRKEEGLVYEAHSTDYQPPVAYLNLVRDGFVILKVGPALTYAMREALEALAAIEDQLVPAVEASHLMNIIEQVMLAHPANWEHHYHGDAKAVKLMRRYSYSDRVRYYWNDETVKQTVAKLVANLRKTTIPQTMLSTYLPDQYRAVRAGTLKPDVEALILHRIRQVLEIYSAAC